MDKQTIKDIEQVLQYLWYDEKRHYEESNKPKTHIFENLKRLRNSIRRICCLKPMEYTEYTPMSDMDGYGCQYICKKCGKIIVYEEYTHKED